MEAAGPARTLPSKEELLAFQARWMRPAGICAIAGGLLIAASLPLQPSASGDDDAERLTKFHDQSTDLIVSQGILLGLAVLLFIPLLYVLIRSAQGRTERIPRPLVALAFVGPTLFAASGLLVALGLSDTADKFVEQAPARERQAREAAQSPARSGTATTTPKPTTTPQPTTTTPQPATTPTPTPAQAAANARDDLANDLIDDSGLLQAGTLLRFIGLISFVFALIYIPLWAMRTGLLTRFWGMLGLALGVSLLLVPVGIFGLVLWFAAVGLMLARWWPAPLPPAWDAGEAIPWPGRQEMGPPPEDRGDADTVEGSGRQVAEQRLPEDDGGELPSQPGRETPSRRRKKRKRRR